MRKRRGAQGKNRVCCTLGAWAAEGVEAKIGPSDGLVFDDFADEYLDIWQESGVLEERRSQK